MPGQDWRINTDKLDESEIITINSLLENKGIGTTLLNEAVNAHARPVRRVLVITTNDNLDALRFWQKRGFTLVTIYPNAMESTRRLKPAVPIIGDNGIPIRDEIELELRL